MHQLNEIQSAAEKAFNEARSSKELYEAKVRFLGKSGQFSNIMKEMGGLSPAERPLFGKAINEVKASLEQLFLKKNEELKNKELYEKLLNESVDLSLPGPFLPIGTFHPITIIIDEIVSIFNRLGFSVRTGPLIEEDRYNFEALNFPDDHPARDMQETFFIDHKYVLRTHTSPIQIRTMEQEKPPLRILAPGTVFRRDSDISHLPQFNQIEGLLVDHKVSMADLKGTLAFFVKEFFDKEVKIRFRPSFFPFTEPSAEVDCSCPICQSKGCRMCGNSGWVEIAGCGLVHPNVFKFCGLSYPEWKGFAFGFGIERMAIIKYRIDDIRLFIENDLRFLGQFTT